MEKTSRLGQILMIVGVAFFLLTALQSFLVPLAYGLMIALIVYPVCKKLEGHKIPRTFAVFLSILLVVFVLGAVLIIFFFQVQALQRELPKVFMQTDSLITEIQDWIRIRLNVSVIDQNNMLKDFGKNMMSNISGIVSGSFSIASHTLFNLIIIPLYTALFLIYRGACVKLVVSLLGKNHETEAILILKEATHVYFNYIKGMVMVYIVVGVLNSIGLLLLGVDYAIVFGMASAFMTIIPYIGITISAILPMIIVWTETNNVLYPIGVVAVYSIVQYLEANLIFPYIVGKQLGINTLVSILAILLGGVIWGVSGMILFIPFTALLKIISGHIESLKPLHAFMDIPGK